MKKLICMIIATVVLIAMCGCSDSDNDTNSDTAGRNTEIYYYPADYDENIYENSAYAEKVSDVCFINSGISVYLNSDNLADAGLDSALFIDYFTSIKDGNAELMNSFIADDYFSEDNPKKEKFTMQKLYDISVEFVENLNLEYQGENITVRDYIVKYKIMYNNGTFRRGLPSDASIPQHYLVGDVDGEAKILNIIDIE